MIVNKYLPYTIPTSGDVTVSILYQVPAAQPVNLTSMLRGGLEVETRYGLLLVY